jgi:hypothetical protein
MTVLADALEVARSVRIEHELARRGFPFWTKPRNNNLGQPCPMCGGDDRFSVNTRKQVWRCRGCNEPGGDVIALVQHLDGVSFPQAVDFLNGLEVSRASTLNQVSGCNAEDNANLDAARAIWRASVDPRGTLVEVALRRDGLSLPKESAHQAIRYNGACALGDEVHPAMVCLVRDILSNNPIGIHRTALSPAGDAIKRNGKTFRMSLGQVSGGAIKIDRHSSVSYTLSIGEGIETCLAGRHYGYLPCWSVISDGGIKHFPLIPGVEKLHIFVDNDGAGEKSAGACKDRWTEAGRHVRFVRSVIDNDLRDELRSEQEATKDASEGFLAAAQAIWPGAHIVADAEKAERAQFMKELAKLKESNAIWAAGRRGVPCPA